MPGAKRITDGMKLLAFPLALLALTIAAPAQAADVQVYFSPNGGCTAAIVREIAAAQSEIDFQAYSFTSSPISRALEAAEARGVKVTAILDKINEGPDYSCAHWLVRANIPVYTDATPPIAHSKILIIDRATVITGSFNFTKAAEEDNAENLLILKNDPKLVAAYLANFQNRLTLSRPYAGQR